MPERIQLSRAKGWRMPENTVKVDRATRWGNPYVVWFDDGEETWLVSKASCHWPVSSKAEGTALAVKMFSDWLRDGLAKELYPPGFMLRDIRGKNLACWCGLDQPCHADVLLELANQ
jgi:hypothetical protein